MDLVSIAGKHVTGSKGVKTGIGGKRGKARTSAKRGKTGPGVMRGKIQRSQVKVKSRLVLSFLLIGYKKQLVRSN